jgi:hypothetical protein
MSALQFLEVGHDPQCPGRWMDGQECDCKPTLRFHSDVQRYLAGQTVNRAQRRAAEREAARAVRRAMRGRR